MENILINLMDLINDIKALHLKYLKEDKNKHFLTLLTNAEEAYFNFISKIEKTGK